MTNAPSTVHRPAAAPGTIQVWSDLLCPFAHVALHRLRVARERLGLQDQVRIDHHAFPLELFNGPHPRPGTDSEAVGLGAIEPAAGFRLWTAADWLYPNTVLLANEAVAAAKAQGLGPAEDLDHALRRAFWVDNRTIGHRTVILEIAAETGTVDVGALTEALDTGRHRADVMADYAVAQTDEVNGSPHLFTADGTDVHNPGIAVHWEGPWASGFPVVDAHDSDWTDALLKKAAG
ncbi:DsbA family oxidoreductase [Amycolatopsis viridis]|uniref:DsbA family dithiol-disulfide isomerase n=1 Tax=Amycolatopsis viridis TaxID=185678 RepID=A0ABX0SYD4_9PSEU|nr:DsbA family protein [Amycolatopsis viridis]NIH81645.1 putative DsbA family dithiol-disulfide isomerase [Amycolatopsis viridis]